MSEETDVVELGRLEESELEELNSHRVRVNHILYELGQVEGLKHRAIDTFHDLSKALNAKQDAEPGSVTDREIQELNKLVMGIGNYVVRQNRLLKEFDLAEGAARDVGSKAAERLGLDKDTKWQMLPDGRVLSH